MADTDQSTDTEASRGWLPSPSCLFAVTLSVILVPVGCWIGWRVHRQQARLEYFQELGGRVRVKTEPATPVWLHGLVTATFGEEHAAGFTKVTVISLTEVTDADLQYVSGLTNLQELFLNNTQVTDASLEHLTGLTNLELLWLGHTQVTDAGLEDLSDLTNLQVLWIGHTRVTDVGLQHLSGLTNLQDLSLADTQITDAGLQHLRGLTNLKELYLYDTQVTDAGAEELRSQLPGVTVFR